MNGSDLRAKRTAVGIPGYAVCRKIRKSRSWLTSIERGYISVTTEELRRIDSALDEIIWTRQRLAELATEAGLSLTGVNIDCGLNGPRPANIEFGSVRSAATNGAVR